MSNRAYMNEVKWQKKKDIDSLNNLITNFISYTGLKLCILHRIHIISKCLWLIYKI